MELLPIHSVEYLMHGGQEKKSFLDSVKNIMGLFGLDMDH